ncbi:hypothetical protein HPB50_019511 [Hyalomma asiaticum]|uniref:Uncharacterized protein n=1 Tax=Hyalomma asiaticum TaxID=266040 RepID=A0ACB7SLM1_HYAAI|nr:hypothetical protein HPB50_019511 [Hyalomma asiaticum]
MASLTAQVPEYAEQLARQNWHASCDQVQVTLSIKKTWNLLRALLEDALNKTYEREHLRLLALNYDGSEEDLFHQLCEKFRGASQPATTLPPFKEYESPPSTALYQPGTLAELHAAIAKVMRSTSPDKDDCHQRSATATQ